MKPDFREAQFCEHEQAVGAALRNGAIREDLLSHISCCKVCTEVVTVSQFLLQSVASEKEVRVPDAAYIFRRAQAMARQQAIAKATRPIRIAQFGAAVAAILALPWVGPTFMNSSVWMPYLGHLSWRMDRPMSDALIGTVLWGVLGSLLLVSLSSWYVLRQE